MLRQRLITATVLIPLGIGLIYVGGWALAVLLALFYGLAAYELGRIFEIGGHKPAVWLLTAACGLMPLAQYAFGTLGSMLTIIALVLVSTFWFVVRYEAGQEGAALDFMITLGGALYIGGLGVFLIAMRDLPNGMHWLVLVIAAVGLADTGAYWIGSRLGKHKFAPRTSPKKTWEGYFGGILFSTLGGWGFASLWHLAVPAMTGLDGIILGLVMGILCPLGDLGESLLKRPFGLKDSSHLLPGHGGMLDRIDSWLWAGVLGYILVRFFLG
jgi:phosphatidate cytidylyltransferase